MSTTCNWIGLSGTSYTYHIHKLPVSFNANQDGNYIYTKLNEKNQWVPVYIGEGDLGSRCTDKHHKSEAIKAKGATHIHVHLNSNEQNRISEEKDLLGNYVNSYAPYGCNEKIGG